jgi:hypothetical protein
MRPTNIRLEKFSEIRQHPAIVVGNLFDMFGDAAVSGSSL